VSFNIDVIFFVFKLILKNLPGAGLHATLLTLEFCTPNRYLYKSPLNQRAYDGSSLFKLQTASLKSSSQHELQVSFVRENRDCALRAVQGACDAVYMHQLQF
jgi:hypothetical protein